MMVAWSAVIATLLLVYLVASLVVWFAESVGRRGWRTWVGKWVAIPAFVLTIAAAILALGHGVALLWIEVAS